MKISGLNKSGHRFLAVLAMCIFGFSLPALAGTPKVAYARIIKLGKTSYEFQVTVEHVDTSWDHHVDRWEIIGPGGRVLGNRVLHHPHIGELHVMRELRGVTIPEGVEHVIIRVHDKVHGYGREKLMTLPTDKKKDTGVQ
jgi:hypothetical protein